jgi:hypothetical protein
MEERVGRPRREIDILQTFRVPHVLTLDELSDRLSCSRRTVLRRLDEHGYFSSYNCSGRFLTIPEVAEFDSRGLWVWKTARFSKHGNLKQTITHLVEADARGMTQEELAADLGVRAYNALLELVHERKIYRERLGSTFTYFSRKPSERREQVDRRKSFLQERQKSLPTSRQIIATLLELIRNPAATRQQIVSRCQGSGVAISPAVVDTVFEMYELDKKRALSRSSTSFRRSGRGPPPR